MPQLILHYVLMSYKKQVFMVISQVDRLKKYNLITWLKFSFVEINIFNEIYSFWYTDIFQ